MKTCPAFRRELEGDFICTKEAGHLEEHQWEEKGSLLKGVLCALGIAIIFYNLAWLALWLMGDAR
jgi:hypothetical protein